MILAWLFAIVFVYLAYKKPVWALGLILALTPTYLIRFNFFGLPSTLLEVLIGLFLFATLSKLGEKRLLEFRNLGKINWAVLLFLLAGILSTIVSPDHTKALGELKAFIVEPILLFYTCIWVLKKAEDKKTVFRLIFTAATLISVFGIIQYFTFIDLPIRFWGTGFEIERITSVFEYPNALALYLAPLFIFFATLWLNKFRLYTKTWVEPLGLGLMAWALLLTFSRGAWFAVIVMSLILILKKYSWKKVVPALFLLLILLLLINPIRQRVFLGLTDPASLARGDLMKVGINKIIHSPFLGNGLYGFPTTLRQANFTGEILNYPHNIFLNFWLELGLLGLIAFGWIIYLCSEQLKKHPDLVKFASGMFLFTLIIHGLVDVPYFKNDLSVLFWYITALFFV
ncbi:MAG TPA: O-antigen ligase family protein [Methylomirabilota bacterium]|jgi:O-antigen ligase|nr:O-antigen ligase family protein [Methylomirabilota bacterium]